jgi:hypothetical protein
MDRADEHRRRAADCLHMADRVVDHQFKASLIDMAGAWVRLAEQADRNRSVDLVYETPPRPPAHAAQQQQQQQQPQQQQQQPEPKPKRDD